MLTDKSPLLLTPDRPTELYSEITLLSEQNIEHRGVPLEARDALVLDKPRSLTLPQILKRIFSYGTYTALSFTFSMGLGVIAFWGPRVAKEGDSTDILAALSLITNTKQLVSGIAITSLYAMSVLGSVKVGQLRDGGESQKAKIGVIYRNGVIWGLTLALPLSMLYYFSEEVLIAIGQPEVAAKIAQSYLRPYTPALPLLALRICAQEMLFAFEKPKVAMLLALPSLAISIGVSAGFIYGLDMGLEGLAYGFLTESALTAIALNAYILLGRGEFKDIPFLKSFIRDYGSFFKDLGGMLKVGGVIALQSTGFFFADTLVDLLAGRFGKKTLAAQNFVTQYSFILVIFILAFGQSIMQEVGRLRGGRSFEDASRYARIGFLASLSIALFPGIAVAIYPKMILDIFSSTVEPDVATMAQNLLRIAVAGRIADAGLYNLIQVSRQAGDRNIPTFAALLQTLGVGVTTGYLLGNFTDLDVYGVNIGYFGGLALSLSSLIWRWWQKTDSNNLRTEQDNLETRREQESSWFQSGYSTVSSCFSSCCNFFSQRRNTSSPLMVEVLSHDDESLQVYNREGASFSSPSNY